MNPATDNDLDTQIDDYLEGRMGPEQRSRFEARMSREPALKERVASATRSLELVQDALGWVTPNDEFDSKVSSKIAEITQSGTNLKPAVPSSERALTSDDPDARLLGDPTAAREKRRLLILAVAAAVVFSAVVCLLIYAVTRR